MFYFYIKTLYFTSGYLKQNQITFDRLFPQKPEKAENDAHFYF